MPQWAIAHSGSQSSARLKHFTPSGLLKARHQLKPRSNQRCASGEVVVIGVLCVPRSKRFISCFPYVQAFGRLVEIEFRCKDSLSKPSIAFSEPGTKTRYNGLRSVRGPPKAASPLDPAPTQCWFSLVEIRHLAYFIAACQHLHLAKAAAEMDVAQSTLSMALKAIEEDIGVPLLAPAKVGLLPTPPALWLFQAATPLLHAESFARHFVPNPRDGILLEHVVIRPRLIFTIGRLAK